MDSETIQYFLSFGLTEYESKALLSLIQKGALEAPETSMLSEIPKTRVYDILEKLEEKGLVVSLQGRPKKYQSIESDKIIDRLLELKKKEFNEIEEKALKLRELLEFSEKQEEKEHVSRVKHLNDFDRILEQEILKAKKSVLCFTETKEKRNLLQEALAKAVQRKVKVKLISNNKEIESFLNGKIEAKNSVHSLNAFVIDDKKIVLGLNSFEEEKPQYHFAILHNKSLAEAISNHFNEKWGK
ncbi:MAG: helix-turn-helix domain-containing protein [archaeon]